MTRQLRGIIVGTGRAGTFLQRGAFLAAGAEIVAFVDIDQERARKAAEEYAVSHYYDSLQEALNRHQVDFVSVCTPARSHLSVAATALRTGCHVLVEKPIADSLEEAEELRRIAEECGRTVCVVHNHKFYPGIQQAVQLQRSGAIGEIVHVDRQMTFIHSRVRMMEPDHWAHQIPGGRLFEANPHNLYLAYAFVGRMQLEHIHARKVSGRWPYAQIDEFTATLSAKRATVQITMSLNLEPSSHYPWHGPNFLVITGAKGTLLVDYHRCLFLEQALRDSMVRSARTIAKFVPRKALAVIRRLCLRRSAARFNDGASSGHKYLIERFLGYLQGRYSEPPTSWEEVLTTQRLNYEMGSAIEEQIREGKAR